MASRVQQEAKASDSKMMAKPQLLRADEISPHLGAWLKTPDDYASWLEKQTQSPLTRLQLLTETLALMRQLQNDDSQVEHYPAKNVHAFLHHALQLYTQTLASIEQLSYSQQRSTIESLTTFIKTVMRCYQPTPRTLPLP